MSVCECACVVYMSFGVNIQMYVCRMYACVVCACECIC